MTQVEIEAIQHKVRQLIALGNELLEMTGEQKKPRKKKESYPKIDQWLKKIS